MPERLIAKLDDAMETQERLIREVQNLQVSKRRLEQIVALLIAVLIGVGLLASWSRQAAVRANNAIAATRVQTAIAAEQTKAYNTAACQTRNGAFASVRDALTNQYQVWEQVIHGLPSGSTPLAEDFLAKMRNSLPKSENQDLDCNRDGHVDGQDYPQRPVS